jgi:hypothetical protein
MQSVPVGDDLHRTWRVVQAHRLSFPFQRGNVYPTATHRTLEALASRVGIGAAPTPEREPRTCASAVRLQTASTTWGVS